MAFLLISLIFSQFISQKEYFKKRREILKKKDFNILEKISYENFKRNPRNFIFLSDYLLSLAALSKDKKFFSFADTLYKYFKSPSFFYPVIKNIEKEGFYKYSLLLIDISRKKFKNKNLFMREYMISLLRTGKYDEFIDEFLKIRNKIFYSNLFKDYLSKINDNKLRNLFNFFKKKNEKNLLFLFEDEFIKRRMYDNLVELYGFLNKKEKRDSFLIFLYKKDQKVFRDLLNKYLDNCEKGYILFKVKKYDEAYVFLENCEKENYKDEKILSYAFYLLSQNKIKKVDSLVKEKKEKLKSQNLKKYLAFLYYNMGYFNKVDSILSSIESFDALFLRAKSSILNGKFLKADSLISKAILRYPDNDSIYKALFVYYLLRYEENKKIAQIIKLNDKIEKEGRVDLENIKDVKWRRYFYLKSEILKGKFIEVKDTLLNKNLLASLYFEGFKLNFEKKRNKEAIKFLNYILTNFKDTPYFIIAQRINILYFGGS